VLGWLAKLSCALGLVSLFIPVGSAATADVDWDRILNREIVVDAVKNAEGIRGVRAAFAVAAPSEKIWAALVDYERFDKVFLGIDKMQVLEQDPSGAKVAFWVDAVLTDLHYVLYRSYEQPGVRLTWKRLSGDMERIEGSWEIRDTPRPNVKLLTYESYVEIGGIVPTWLIQQGAVQKAQDMALRLRTWIEDGTLSDDPG
jgi:uncharacterized membrane protein